MGEHQVGSNLKDDKFRDFTRSILDDLSALEQMIRDGRIESGVRRIGAEQEMFLVDHNCDALPLASEVLRLLADECFTTEIGQFNLEINVPPLDVDPFCLRNLNNHLEELINQVRKAARARGGNIVLTGILPTLRLSDLTLANLTDQPRYHELNRILTELRGNKFYVHIKGIDEIDITHDNMMLEACNTSFQFHVQTDPASFADSYNSAQALTAPLLAGAVNSPLLLNRRLWQETRLALFQHSVDERSSAEQGRSRPPRVSFGERWVHESVLEIYKEDLTRFRILLTCPPYESSTATYAEGNIPSLSALRLHTGTVWRWNRACFGVHNGQPQLRIENRVLPSGPTVLDEVANAAFFLGALQAFPAVFPNLRHRMPFDHAKANLYAAARYGLQAGLSWLDGRTVSVRELLLSELIPLARQGLQELKIDSQDIDQYLGIFEQRVHSQRTGAHWILQSYVSQEGEKAELRARIVTEAMLSRQNSGEPVHRWEPAQREELHSDFHYQRVGQFMSTDLFTVRPDDLVELAAGIMDWQHVRHLPVEDEQGQLVGIVSHRDLLHFFVHSKPQNRAVPVRDIMKQNPICIGPDMLTLEASRIMKQFRIGCLPVVVEKNRLVGIVTVYDLLGISYGLLEEALSHGSGIGDPFEGKS